MRSGIILVPRGWVVRGIPEYSFGGDKMSVGGTSSRVGKLFAGEEKWEREVATELLVSPPRF